MRYMFEVTYSGALNKNIILNPMDSGLIKNMKQRQIDNLSLIANFYGYDGDGLVGYVNGQVTATVYR